MSFTYTNFEIRGKKISNVFLLPIFQCNIINKHPQNNLTLFSDMLLKSIQIVNNGK
jgi:hypothetical protein